MDQASSAAAARSDEPFRPGQLGMRHLLGAMTVAAIVLGVSAARLRTLTAVEATQVAVHWATVLSISGVTYFIASMRRRRERAAAGDVLLRVQSKPVTERQQRSMRWLFTMLVVIDGISISLNVFPGLRTARLVKSGLPASGMLWAVLQGVVSPMVISEGLLWGWCLNLWLTNIYRVEFREHGILIHAGYFPWKGISRLGWSTLHPNRLVFFQGGHIREVAIDPASHDAVSELLEKVHSNAAIT